jgi:hypothetical protein
MDASAFIYRNVQSGPLELSLVGVAHFLTCKAVTSNYSEPIFRMSIPAVRTTPKVYKLNAGSKISRHLSPLFFAAEYEIFDYS